MDDSHGQARAGVLVWAPPSEGRKFFFGHAAFFFIRVAPRPGRPDPIRTRAGGPARSWSRGLGDRARCRGRGRGTPRHACVRWQCCAWGAAEARSGAGHSTARAHVGAMQVHAHGSRQAPPGRAPSSAPGPTTTHRRQQTLVCPPSGRAGLPRPVRARAHCRSCATEGRAPRHRAPVSRGVRASPQLPASPAACNPRPAGPPPIPPCKDSPCPALPRVMGRGPRAFRLWKSSRAMISVRGEKNECLFFSFPPPIEDSGRPTAKRAQDEARPGACSVARFRSQGKGSVQQEARDGAAGRGGSAGCVCARARAGPRRRGLDGV